MANSAAIPQLNQMPYKVVGNDSTQAVQTTGLYQARYINLQVQGPGGIQNIGAVASVQTKETMAFSQRPYMGTDALEKVIGDRQFTATITRDVPRGQLFKQLVQLVYAPGLDNGDVRLDVLPVSLIITYNLVGPNLNYSAAIESQVVVYNDMTCHDVTEDRQVGNVLRETLLFMGQLEQISENNKLINVSTPNSYGYARING